MSRTQIIKADVECPGIYASVNLNGFTLTSEERPANHRAVLLGYRVPHIPEVWFGVGYRDGDRYWLGPRGLDPHYVPLNADQVLVWMAVEWPFQFDEDRADTSTYLQYRYMVGEGPWDTEEQAKAEWERRRTAGVAPSAETSEKPLWARYRDEQVQKEMQAVRDALGVGAVGHQTFSQDTPTGDGS